MPDPLTGAMIVIAFLVAGTVKGTVGLGLPTISLGLLILAVDLPVAMALVLVPSFVINVWQSLVGGYGREILRRTWPFLLAVTTTVWIGAAALARADLNLLSALLGALLIIHALANLSGFRIALTPRQSAWAGPFIGAINGVLTGMTGSFTVPGVMYLQALGLEKDALIQAMGMLFTVSTIALAAALGGQDMLSAQLGFLSLAALVPATVGVFFGQRIRRYLSEVRFRNVFLSALLALGAYIIVNALIQP